MMPAHRRCAEHGLATGDDGRCVLCRRAASSGGRPIYDQLVFATLGALALGIVGAFAYRRTPAPLADVAPTAEPRATDAAELLPAARPPSPAPPPRPSVARPSPASPAAAPQST
jgi:hypothetical protein